MVDKIKQQIDIHRDSLLEKANVVGLGIGRQQTKGETLETLALSVFVRKKIPEKILRKKDLLPKALGSLVTIDVVETGEIQALTNSRMEKHRPVVGGISASHFEGTAGTVGCVIYKNGIPFLLSNNHVFAQNNAASLGDAIVQPGFYDSGRLADSVVGTLLDFVPIEFIKPTPWYKRLFRNLLRLYPRYPENQIDAAICSSTVETSKEIYELGSLSGAVSVALGDKVKKSGRTTGITEGEVTHTNVEVIVNYGKRQAYFVNQFMTNLLSKPGDSGSVIVRDTPEGIKAVGLLFAGSDTVTVANDFNIVMGSLHLAQKDISTKGNPVIVIR